jgi:hypothetical protein
MIPQSTRLHPKIILIEGPRFVKKKNRWEAANWRMESEKWIPVSTGMTAEHLKTVL